MPATACMQRQRQQPPGQQNGELRNGNVDGLMCPEGCVGPGRDSARYGSRRHIECHRALPRGAGANPGKAEGGGQVWGGSLGRETNVNARALVLYSLLISMRTAAIRELLQSDACAGVACGLPRHALPHQHDKWPSASCNNIRQNFSGMTR